MKQNVRIAPSILAADFSQLGAQIHDVEAAGADWIHVDVMDGRFVPNITMGPVILEAVRRSTQLPLDVHLMIVEPDHLLSAFAKAGATRISVHWEACPNLHRTLQTIKELGCAAGVAINPHTPASFISEILSMLDVILVMTVNPGFGGQTFLPETLPKIRALREMVGERSIDIAVDGGINAETIPAVIEAGADLLIVGSAVYSAHQPISSAIAGLRQVIAETEAKEKPV